MVLLVLVVVGIQEALSLQCDDTFMKWSCSKGVVAPKIELVTSTRSVAGRGLFLKEDAKKGEILAALPDSLTIKDQGNGPDWQSRLISMLYAQKSQDAWTEWFHAIKNLKLPWHLSESSEDIVSARLQELADQSGADFAQLHIEVQDRRKGYRRRKNTFAKQNFDLSYFDLAYAAVISRSARIPGAVALIPFFDMLNHAPVANTDLVPFARIKDQCEPSLASLLAIDDLLLIASTDIEAHSELFTCYKEYTSSSSSDRAFVDAILALQWDIPPPLSSIGPATRRRGDSISCIHSPPPVVVVN